MPTEVTGLDSLMQQWPKLDAIVKQTKINTIGFDSLAQQWPKLDALVKKTKTKTPGVDSYIGHIPDKVADSEPEDGEVSSMFRKQMTWEDGGGPAVSYDVYFGKTDPPDFIGNQTAKIYNPGTLSPTTQYYWRVDPINSYGTTTGNILSFKTSMPITPHTTPKRQMGMSLRLSSGFFNLI